MARCAHLLLCHDAPALNRARIEALREAGDCVAVHVDARAPEMRRELQLAFLGDPGVAFAPSLRCGWGDWSLVAATIALMRLALERFAEAGHLMLGSTDCLPTQPAAALRAALRADPRDRIETADFLRSDWIKTGLREERVQHFHFVNERAHPRLFYRAARLQRALGVRRRLPDGVDLRIGSQWWLLRAATAQAALDLHDRRPELARFFRRVWIPDECYLQSLVAMVTPEEARIGAPPTRLMFTDYGRPVAFHADHEALLRAGRDRFFARKIARGDEAFRARLLRLYPRGEAGADPTPRAALAAGAADARGAVIAAEPSARMGTRAGTAAPGAPEALYHALRERGRRGLRAGPRIWERAGTPDPSRLLVAVLAKKWHLAESGAALIAEAAGLPAWGPVFDDPAPIEALALRGGEALAAAGGLGGLDSSVEKRRRAPGMLLEAICAGGAPGGLVFAADPARAGVLAALAAAGARLAVVEIAAPCSDGYLLGHAERIGLWSGAAPPALRAEILRSLRAEIAAESRALAALGLPRFVRIGVEGESSGAALAAALSLPEARGARLAAALARLGD